jgi:purine catabolism regulator
MFAGASGLGREVSWAQVCELPDPTEWLSSGELLLTVGYTVPEDPPAQQVYIERLAEAGLSGLLIAEKLYAPELSDELVSAADRCSFPVLLNSYEVPFTSVVRVVADANRTAEHARLLQVLRVYERARAAVGGRPGSHPLAKLGDIVGCDLFVVDPESGLSLFPNSPKVPPELVSAMRDELAGRAAPMPAILRLGGWAQPSAAVPVPASRPAALVAVAKSGDMPETSVLHHIAAVTALELEKLVAEYERRRRLGSELLAGLVDGRLAPDLADHQLLERHLSDEPRLIASCNGDADDDDHTDLHLKLEDRGIPHLLLRRTPILTALLPDAPEMIDAFCEEVGSLFPVGLSSAYPMRIAKPGGPNKAPSQPPGPLSDTERNQLSHRFFHIL